MAWQTSSLTSSLKVCLLLYEQKFFLRREVSRSALHKVNSGSDLTTLHVRTVPDCAIVTRIATTRCELNNVTPGHIVDGHINHDLLRQCKRNIRLLAEQTGRNTKGVRHRQITALALSMKMRVFGLLVDMVRLCRDIPPFMKAGDTLKQMVLTPIGFRDSEHLVVLLRHVNNEALERGVGHIFTICERDYPLLSSMKGFMRVDTAIHLYVKPLQEGVVLGDKPVYIDGIDL